MVYQKLFQYQINILSGERQQNMVDKIVAYLCKLNGGVSVAYQKLIQYQINIPSGERHQNREVRSLQTAVLRPGSFLW